MYDYNNRDMRMTKIVETDKERGEREREKERETNLENSVHAINKCKHDQYRSIYSILSWFW